MLDPASPSGFLPLATRVLPWLAGVTALAFIVGLVQAFNAPDDFQQGATVLLMGADELPIGLTHGFLQAAGVRYDRSQSRPAASHAT